eukprot:8362260-Lingulodinium_polyedra.AAC.1
MRPRAAWAARAQGPVGPVWPVPVQGARAAQQGELRAMAAACDLSGHPAPVGRRYVRDGVALLTVRTSRSCRGSARACCGRP